jgi:hypothetical protein
MKKPFYLCSSVKKLKLKKTSQSNLISTAGKSFFVVVKALAFVLA